MAFKEKLSRLLDQLKPTQVIQTPREENSSKNLCQCFSNTLNCVIFGTLIPKSGNVVPTPSPLSPSRDVMLKFKCPTAHVEAIVIHGTIVFDKELIQVVIIVSFPFVKRQLNYADC